MTSYKRLKINGAVYFFTLVLNDRIGSNLLIAEFNQLKESIKKVKASYPFKLNAMVVSPDHLHMIMSLAKNDTDYSVRIRLIKTYFSKSLNKTEAISTSRKSKEERGIWQRRYWEYVIRNETDFINHLNYIHFNPVKHGCCNRAVDWPYSTFHNYVEKGLYPESWAITPLLSEVEAGE